MAGSDSLFGFGKGPPALLLFLAGMLISNIGRSAYFVCVTWIALTWSNSARLVTILLFTSTLAQFLTSGVSGYFADMVDRRRLSVSLDVVRALVVALTGCAIAAKIGIWVLFLSVALYSVVDRGYLTAMQSMIPALSRRRSAIAANSASYLVMQAGTFLGALLAGYLLHTLPYGIGLFPIAIIFATSAVTLSAARTELSDSTNANSNYSKPRFQLRFMYHLGRHRLIAPTLLYSLGFGVGFLFSSLLAAYVLDEMKGGAVLFGQMESAWAFGAVLACLLLISGAGKLLADFGLAPLLFLSGTGLILLWMFPGPIIAATLLVALGVIYNASRILMDARVQQTVGITEIGRTKGAINTVATGTGLLAFTVIAMAGDTLAPSDIFAQYGLLAIAVAASFLLPALRGRPRSHDEDRSA
ncbi:MAG: MFS transporter [Proteobacteria bacterium]|nr:MFS transporter [Pseudomonadota bacterium]